MGTGAAKAQTVTIQETGYAGLFTESDTCNPGTGTIATVTTADAHGPSATYTVTGVKAGSCVATFSDSASRQTTVNIFVTTNVFQGN